MSGAHGHYEPLPSMPEEAPPPPGGEELGALLLGEAEAYDWGAVANLDAFFTRIYRYWEAKGFGVMLLSRLLNLAALGFTVLMSALLLLYVNWGALQAECLRRDTCDLMQVAFRRHPLEGGLTLGRGLAVLYLLAFSAYWLVAAAHLVHEVRDLAEIRHFCNHKLGVSERQLATITWPEIAHRLVQVQRTTRLCIARDLGEHDVVSRIMRKENFLIAMLNKGVLALNVPIPGLRHHLLLTKTLEWNLYWCVLDALFDDHFRIRRSFLYDERALQRRFRVMALLNLTASPFMLLFLLIYFFMKNAERFYHHPSTIGARRWSQLAKWRLREFNELPHFIAHRLNASHTAAERYIQQFPNHALSHVARFVAFVSGSFAALLLALALIDERLLERDLLGRQIVWWVATVGMVLALSRAFIIDSGVAFDPEAALMGVVAHTHYLPRHWRGRAHTREVQEQFEALFQYKALLFLEELASCLLTPFVLYFSLPKCAGAILRFVEENTTHVEGVGDVCSLAAFDFARHGNAKYGAPAEAPKAARSRQGKMEKSFLSFAAAYPQWEAPEGPPRRFLGAVAAQALHPRPATLAATASVLMQASGAAGWGTGSVAWGGAAGGAPAGALGVLGSQLLQQSGLPPSPRLHPQQSPQQQHGRQHGKPSSGIFASAELEYPAGAAWGPPAATLGHGAALARPAAGPLSALQQVQLGLAGGAVDASERVALSQMLLQSIYEEHEAEEEVQRNGGGLHHPGTPLPAPSPAAAQQPAPAVYPYNPAPPHQPQPQPQPQAQQHPAVRRASQQGMPEDSPRQVWLRPGPAVQERSRQVSSELSVLSREPSGAAELPRSPAAALHHVASGGAGRYHQPQPPQPQRGLLSGELSDAANSSLHPAGSWPGRGPQHGTAAAAASASGGSSSFSNPGSNGSGSSSRDGSASHQRDLGHDPPGMEDELLPGSAVLRMLGEQEAAGGGSFSSDVRHPRHRHAWHQGSPPTSGGEGESHPQQCGRPDSPDLPDLFL